MTECKDDPRAPHGFLRNASHNADEYVCECKHWQSPFDSWYNGLVGFHINSECILDDVFQCVVGPNDADRLRKWMVVCWNNAIEAAINEIADDPFAHHESNLEKLKEPLDKQAIF